MKLFFAIGLSVSLCLNLATSHIALGKQQNSKKRQVSDLLSVARKHLKNRNYTKAIEAAEKVRRIVIPRETKYLSEAKSVIDQARLLLNENFEPFVRAAKDRMHQKDYQAAKDICEQMLKRDPNYEPAKQLLREVDQLFYQSQRRPASVGRQQ